MTSFNCVFGIAAGNAFLASLVFVFCSYANANPVSLNSLNAVPKNDSPNGTPGAGYTVSGPADWMVTFGG